MLGKKLLVFYGNLSVTYPFRPTGYVASGKQDAGKAPGGDGNSSGNWELKTTNESSDVYKNFKLSN